MHHIKCVLLQYRNFVCDNKFKFIYVHWVFLFAFRKILYGQTGKTKLFIFMALTHRILAFLKLIIFQHFLFIQKKISYTVVITFSTLF